MVPHHTVVWLDHNDAHVFHFVEGDIQKLDLHSQQAGQHLRHKVARTGEDKHYYEAVAHALAESKEILIVGPSSAKLSLVKYLHASAPHTMEKVVGVESVDHPSDNQLLAHARQYFVHVDRMRNSI
jgi:stalled ribosome rescue protein Dom34